MNNSMIDFNSIEMNYIPLLVPEMPNSQDLMPWLKRIEESKYYSNFGPLSHHLESVLAAQFRVTKDECTTVANATLALELVLQALNLPYGAKILIPAFTFVATATAVIRSGFKPVLVDVDSKSWVLTPNIASDVCRLMKIDAVVSVAAFGMPHDMRQWNKFEEETGVPVVIDAAAAYGSQWLNDTQGTLVFSLHATKSLPAGEGAIVVSNRRNLVAKVRELSNFGINLNENSSIPVGSLVSVGTNAKMSEYHSAVALASLKKWSTTSNKRKKLHMSMISAINSLCGDEVILWQKECGGGGIMAPTLLCAKFTDSRYKSAIERKCVELSIQTRRWYQPILSNMNCIKEKSICLNAPNALDLENNLLGFPFFPSMTKKQKNTVVSIFKS